MEVTLLSSRAVPSLSRCPSSSYPSTSRILAHSTAACSTTTPALAGCPSFLHIRLESSAAPSSSSSSFYRSSIYGTNPVHYVSSFGTVSLLLRAPAGLFKRQAEPVERRSGSARAYLEPTNPILKFLNKVQGALPVVGLISRLVSPEGGVGTDRIRFEEFCTRVGRNCDREDSRALYLIAERYGKCAKPPFVLIWCWAAAVGAGLLRSEDLLMGASRLRISYDIQFEVENFDLLMDEATKKREKSGSKVPNVPMEFRAEKALGAICKCCTGTTAILEEDAPVFSTILKVVFPTADKDQIDSFVASRLLDPLSANASESDDSQDVDNEEDEGVEVQPQSLVEELLQ